jgi:hypothetical protein
MPDNDIRCLAFQIDSPAPVRFRFLKGRRRHPTKLNRLQHAEARTVRSRHREVEPSRPGMETLTAFSVLFSDFTDDVDVAQGTRALERVLDMAVNKRELLNLGNRRPAVLSPATL